jgi:hypothetical protein
MMRERRVSREAIRLGLGSKRLTVRQWDHHGSSPTRRNSGRPGTDGRGPGVAEAIPVGREPSTDGSRSSWQLDARPCTTANAALSAAEADGARTMAIHNIQSVRLSVGAMTGTAVQATT